MLRRIDWNTGKVMVGGKRTVGFLVLLVLSHGHEASTCGEDFVTKASFVVGLVGISLIIVDLVTGVLSFAWSCVSLMVGLAVEESSAVTYQIRTSLQLCVVEIV